jgi:hypothetical protein
MDIGLGHNRGPEIIDQFDAEILRARLERDYRSLIDRFAELELGAAKVPQKITTEAQAKEVLDWLAQQCKMAIVRAEREHDKEKKPYLDGGRVVDQFFNGPIKRLNNVIGPISRRIQIFFDQKKAEQRRREEAARRQAAQHRARAEAEAARLAAEARAKEEAGDRRAAVELTREAEHQQAEATLAATQETAPPAPVRLHGEYGATAYSIEKWDYEIEDLEAVPDGYWTLDDTAIREAIAEGVRNIPGLRIFPFDQFRMRRC